VAPAGILTRDGIAAVPYYRFHSRRRARLSSVDSQLYLLPDILVCNLQAPGDVSLAVDCSLFSAEVITQQWSKKFHERPQRRGAFFHAGQCNVTPAMQVQSGALHYCWLQQSRCRADSFEDQMILLLRTPQQRLPMLLTPEVAHSLGRISTLM